MKDRALSAENGKALAALIEEGLLAANALVRLLEEEAERLRTRTLDGLQRLLADKANALQVLEQCEQRRRAIVDSLNLSTDERGPVGALNRLDGSGNLSHRWSELLEAVRRCRQLNEHNGLVINRGLEQVDQALAVLRGTHGFTEPGGYGPTGTRHHRGPGHEISRA